MDKEKLIRLCLFALLPYALSNAVNAQTMITSPIETVLVIGKSESSTQNSIDAAKDYVRTIPGGASIVDLNQVREGRQSTWSDSLGLAPGVFIQDRFGSEEARISIRGSALSRTYHSFGIKVLQDGIPINYADGFFDMQTVDPNASRYVEVLRGPNATTYGATSLGGSINFVAPTGRSDPGSYARVELGSFGYNKVFGSAAGVGKTDAKNNNVWDYYVAGSQTMQDGFRDHSKMENQKFIGNFGVKVDSNIESRFYAASVRSRTQLPGYLTKAEQESDPSIANSSKGTNNTSVYPYRDDANRRRDIDTQRIANKTTVKSGNTIYEFAAYGMNYDLWHPIDTIVQQNAKTWGGHLKATQIFNDHQIRYAYLPSIGSTKGTSKPTNDQGVATGSATSDYDQQSKNDSFFVEDKYKLLKPILSRFCEIYIPEPVYNGKSINLYQHNLNNTFKFKETKTTRGEWLKKELEKFEKEKTDKNLNIKVMDLSNKLYEKGYSGLDIIQLLENHKNFTDICDCKRYELLISFNKVRKEFRNEKLLLFFMMNFLLLDLDYNLQNISLM
jgi:iron complex outermembrane receptor protein